MTGMISGSSVANVVIKTASVSTGTADRDGHLRGVFKGGGKSEVQKLSDLVDSVVNE